MAEIEELKAERIPVRARTDMALTAKYLEGRNNPWRVSMTIPTARGVETITTRLDAANEQAALAAGFQTFVRALSRREKGEEASLAVVPNGDGGRRK